MTAGRTVKTTLTVWGGTFAVITADFERVRSGFLMATEPLEDGRTMCHGIVLGRPAGRWGSWRRSSRGFAAC